MEEEWRPIPELEKYEVSSLGNIRHSVRKKVLLAQEHWKGHLCFYYWVSGSKRRKKMYIHRAVALAFLGKPPENCHTVDHINRIRQDNRLENLRWATLTEQVFNRETTFRRRSWSDE